jgi:ribonuclease HI
MGDAAVDTHRRAAAATTSDRSKSTIGAKTTRKKQRKKASYTQEMKPVTERHLGQMELILLTGMDEVANMAQEKERSDVGCPALAILLTNKRGEFARWMQDASNREEAVGVMQGMQWAWDKRKTKLDMEERIIHEAAKLLVESIIAALMDKIQEGAWGEEAKKSGKNVRIVCDTMDALDCGVDVEDYPRVMYEATRILESIEGEQHQADTGHMEEGQQQPAERDAHQHKGEGLQAGSSKSRSKQPRPEGRANAATEDVTATSQYVPNTVHSHR